MKSWISSLALFAYVVGGWLMPAAHHHHQGCSHTSIQISADSERADHHCHHHHHDDPQDDEDRSSPSATVFGVSNHSHAGLCALCAARTLAKAEASIKTLIESDEQSHPSSFDVSHPSAWMTLRANLTRGPPVFA